MAPCYGEAFKMIPWRLCCGKRHYGVQCPDGKCMCCYCFDRFEVDELAIEDGNKIDVCWPCYNWEQERLNSSETN
jgi:hypothetical protein